MPTPSITPRTDAKAGNVLDSTEVHAQAFELDPDGSYVSADYARQLELEIAALKRSSVSADVATVCVCVIGVSPIVMLFAAIAYHIATH